MMKIEDFIDVYNPKMSEYCPVIICEDGEVYECSEGHLQVLVRISGDNEILQKIPKDISPLMYLAAYLHCVVVDYENQIYFGELSIKQVEAIDALDKEGLIKKKLLKMNNEALHL